MRTHQPNRRVAPAALAAAALLAAPVTGRAQSLETCPETSPSASWVGATLDSDTTKDGVVYDGSGGGKLKLQTAGGVFTSTSLGIADLTVYAATADFDRDGWMDFVGIGEGNSFVRIYRNRTFDNPAPDWTNPSAVRTPKFVNVRSLVTGTNSQKYRPVAAGDFNGDGWPDVFRAEANPGERPTVATLWLNQASNDGSGNPRFNSGYTPWASPTTTATVGYQTWSGTNVAVLDYNGDRKLDMLIGSNENNGEIRVFTNQCTLMSPQPTPVPAAPAPLRCSNNPTFKHTATLITNLGYGTGSSGKLPVFSYTDIDFPADGKRDLIVGSPICCSSSSQRLRIYKGITATTVSSSYQSVSFAGGATGILAADFSLDGRLDLIVTTDNWNYNDGDGGKAFYYVNDGDSAPFSGGVTQQLTDILDYDVSFIFNYDNDPANTPDVMVADGNHTSSFYVLANRVVNQFVECGEAASGVIPLNDLESSEMVVTAARIDPQVALNGTGSVTFYLSNEEPPNWVQATDCGDGTGDLCATFPKSSGRDVRWKAYMCSGNNKTTSPTITGMTARFQYTETTEHYRGGTTVNDGIAYLGAFRQPGDRGRFYAINAGLSQTYWEAANKLDESTNDSERRLYTAHRDTGERLDFSVSNASDVGLQATLGAANAAEAADVVEWVRSARFGVGNDGIALSKLGAIETSTPAILTPPGLPTWYLFAPGAQRAKVDQFIANNASRPTLVLFGSKDGIVHALRSRATDISNSSNGKEAWGYIPPHVAGGFLADYSTSIATEMVNSAYPDGSVTLADVHDADGEMMTIALIAAGNGGDSIAAFDVTRTIDPSTNNVLGPTPLWTAIPGGAAAGRAFSKPAVARVEIDNATRFIAIAGTGMSFTDTTPPFEYGRIVEAYDAITGDVLWKFQTRCALTSDIAVFETRDELEPGNPTIDGYMDRAVFADACGYVYKVDPARDLGGGWNVNDGLGSIEADVVDGQQLYALFSTLDTDEALGVESPIAGTLGAQIDGDTSRLVLFFGTGGLESHSVAEQNAFYAVYADTGEIRAQMAGACPGGRCEKFYGGVVVTREQVMFTRTVDPRIGTGTCDRGTSVIQAVQLSTLEDGQFAVDFEVNAAAATMSALYGDAGAVYFSTLGGDVVRVGSPRATEAGGDSATGSANDPLEEGEGTGSLDSPMSLLGWRQVY